MTTSLGRNVRLQRAYDEPTSHDGYRVLVDRLWPRGRSKEILHLDSWARDLGPSTELRKWFGHDPARWEEFRKRYLAELAESTRPQVLDDLAERAHKGPITLVFGSRDVEHNEAQVIAEVLGRRLEILRRRGRTGRAPSRGVNQASGTVP